MFGDTSVKSGAQAWRFLPSLKELLALALLTFLVLLFSATFQPAVSQAAGIIKYDEPRRFSPADREIVVSFDDGISVRAASNLMKRAGLAQKVRSIGPKGARNTHVMQVAPGQSVEGALSVLKTYRSVRYAEKSVERQASFMPDDLGFDSQWYLHNTGQSFLKVDPATGEISNMAGTPNADIDAPAAWNLERGFSNPVTVAVIDSGIDANHPDLENQLWTNTDEIAGNGIDDDGNGYVDDRTGYNWIGIDQGWINIAEPFGAVDQQIAQSIRGTGHSLTKVGLPLFFLGTTPTIEPVLSIRETPGGPDLSTTTLDATDTVLGYVEKNLTTPVDLEDGKEYFIVLSTADTSVGAYFYLGVMDHGGEGYDYKDGMLHRLVNGAWLTFPGQDLSFWTNPDANPRDLEAHGTHVSGIVAAEANNGVGVAGVSHGADIMPLKILNMSGGAVSSNIAAAVYYAVDNGAKVINLSLVGGAPSIAEQVAFNYAASKGVTVFAAAGNDGNGTINFPASYEFVYSIGATTLNDEVASFSNQNFTLDFTAPGQDIFSTIPTYRVQGVHENFEDSFGYMSGTSMASPVAAGAAALILSRKPNYDYEDVGRALIAGRDDLGDKGWDSGFGYGRININRTLRIILDTAAPTVKVTAPWVATRISTNRTFKVSWAGSDIQPSGGIASYDVQYKVTGGAWKNWQRRTIATHRIFENGTPGKTYYFRARARDLAGNLGNWSGLRKTIVPRDNDALIKSRNGFNGVYKNKHRRLYYGSLRYSARGGQNIVFEFTGKRVVLINTKARNRSKAKIYIDGKYVKTIDNYSWKTKFRQATFSKTWSTSGKHTLKIVNLGTPGRRVYDIDAMVAEE